MHPVSDRVRVLAVDDEPDMLFIISELLRGAFEVVTAGNGMDALDHIGEMEPDVIVMDVGMPGLDGPDTARAIRKDSRFTGTPVLFLASRKDSPDLVESLKVQGEAVMRKPFVASEFLKRVDDMVRERAVKARPKTHTEEEIRSRSSPQTEVPGKPFRAAAERPRSLTEQLAEAAAPPRVRVLAVDDDRDTVEFMRSLLREEYEFVGTTDSLEAPDKIIAYQPDILLLDINMPRLNGFHLSRLIRLNRRLRGAKVVFVSSRSDRESVEQAFKLGATEFIEKPFTPEQLRRKLQDVTRRPDFQRIKKRVDYREVMRREGEIRD